MTGPVLVGVSTKSYLGYRRSLEWLGAVTALAAKHPAVLDGRVSPFVAPSFPLLESALRLASGTGVAVMAQDVSRWPAGAHTGDVPASMLAEMGVTLVEIGHAERRAEGETDEVVAAKVALAQEAGLVPLLCVGESVAPGAAGRGDGGASGGAQDRDDAEAAADFCAAQVLAAGSTGRLVVAYEPIWAIGAESPASPGYVTDVVRRLRTRVPATTVIYGGSAGPGLLAALRPGVDGLFLGRRAHDPAGVAAVLDEAAALA